MHKDDPLSNLPSVENTDSSSALSDSATVGGQQGIFSGDDTRIETENLPEAPEIVQQAPMSSITPALRTESTVTGDLKLGDAPKKKKWPLVVLGVVAVATVALGGWALLGNRESEDEAYCRTKTTFLEYVNIVLYGEASTNTLNDFCVADNNCYILQAVRDKDKFHTFFEATTTVKENLYKAVSSWIDILANSNETSATSDSGVDSLTIAQGIRKLLDLYDFLNIYQSHDILKKSDIVNYYLANGEAGIQDYIASYYGSDHGNNIFLNDLRENVVAMGKAVLENINLYAQHGCMTGFMNELCFATNATEDEKALAAENNQIIADYGLEIGAYADIPYAIIDDIILVNDLLNLREQTERK